jgi:hypothetical protein
LSPIDVPKRIYTEIVEHYVRSTINHKELFHYVNRCAVIAIALSLMYLSLNSAHQLVPTTIVRNIVYAGGTKGHINEHDFNITKFGIGTDGNPFLTVEGKAGNQHRRKKILDLPMYL